MNDGLPGEQVDEGKAGRVVGVVADPYVGGPDGELGEDARAADVKDPVAKGLLGLVDVAMGVYVVRPAGVYDEAVVAVDGEGVGE